MAEVGSWLIFLPTIQNRKYRIEGFLNEKKKATLL
jgi:hypothetical protein